MGRRNIRQNCKNNKKNMLINWLKKYWLVIIGAIIVGGFTGLPNLLFLQRMGDNFQGVWPQFNGDSFFYLARAHEVFDGHPEMNHQYFWEHKEDRYSQANNLEYLIAVTSDAFNIDLPTLQVWLDFTAPVLIFLLTFILLYKIAPNKYTAVILPLILYTAVIGGISKPVHPQLSLPILLFFLIFWFELVKFKKQKARNAVLAGVMFGVLFLTYHYHWMFLVPLTGVFILILLLSKKWLELKYHILMLSVALIVGIPYFIQFFQGSKMPYYQEMMVRMGMYYTHMPETFPRLIVGLVWLLFFIFFAKHFKLENNPKAQAIASLLIVNVLFPNHQLITGIVLQNANHWSWMPILIFSIATHYIINFILARRAEKKCRKMDKAILAIAIILLVVPAYRLSTFNLKPFLETYSICEAKDFIHYGSICAEDLQYYRNVFDWVEKYIDSDSVILADDILMNFIPVYTHANIYYSEYAQWLPNSDREITERIMLSRFFDKEYFADGKYGIENNERILWIQPGQTEYNTHIIFDKFGVNWKLDYKPQYSLAKEQEKVRAVYDELQTEGWNINLLKKYRLDYIIWDRNREPDWNLYKYPELMRIYDQDGVEIYKFKE